MVGELVTRFERKRNNRDSHVQYKSWTDYFLGYFDLIVQVILDTPAKRQCQLCKSRGVSKWQCFKNTNSIQIEAITLHVTEEAKE